MRLARAMTKGPTRTSLLWRYEQLSARRPWSVAFVTCTFKGFCADMLVQLAVEKKRPTQVDWARDDAPGRSARAVYR